MASPQPPHHEIERLFDTLEDAARDGDVGLEAIRRVREKVLAKFAHALVANPLPVSGDAAAPGAQPAKLPEHGKANGPDFKTLFESVPGLYLVLDPRLHIIAASNAYLSATKTTRDAIIGRHLFDIFPDNPDDPTADAIRNTRASLNRVIQTRQPDCMVVQRHDIRRPASEGGGFEVRYWSPINSPVLNSDGSLAYIIHRVEDVTEFVQLKQHGAEQAKVTDVLRERTMKMEADLYARSREVADSSLKLKQVNEELARLYAKTRELDALKNDFFANVSHELRTPLTLILGPVRRLLSSANLSEDQSHSLGVIERNAGTLLKNVNNLLDLAKLDAGRLEMEYAECDVARLARFVAAHFESVADENKIHFAIDIPDTLRGEVDPDKLQRVLFNLLSNAFKFTPAGGTVRLRLGSHGDMARFSVEDTGPGVAITMREAIFERFRQGDTSAARRPGGTGLGLAIVREFVGLHHGRVDVSDADDAGARFTVDVPLKAPEGTAVDRNAPPPDEQSARATVAELKHAGPRPPAADGAPADAALVLLIEDNPDMNAFLADALRPHFRIATAFDGEAGLQTAFEIRPDLVIADMMMPRKSGEDVVRELRRNRDFDSMPILLLTAKADQNLRTQWLKMGAQDCLLKPFNVDELVARAGGLVAHKRQAERMLGNERELLTKIIDRIPVMITIYDPAHQTFRFNRELREVLGWTEADAAGGDFLAKVYPDPNYREEVVRYMQSLAPGWRDLETTAKDGSKVLSTWANVRLTNNMSVGIGVDIRARQAAEEALRRSQKLLASTLENFPTVIAFKDREGRFIEVNPPVEKVLRIPKDQILGKTDYDFFPREWADEMRKHDLDVMRTRQPEIREVVTPAPSRTIFHLDTSFPLIDAKGAVYGTGHISHDITPLKLAEEALRERETQLRALNETLEQRVQERTQQLHEANANLQAFANTAAHDLRSPLRTISGFSEVLREEYRGKLDDDARYYLQRIMKAADHMGELLHDLLEFSRLSQAELQLEPVDVQKAAEEALALLDASIQEKNALVTLDAPLPHAIGHRATLTLVINNLIANGLKFVAAGAQPRVRVRAEEDEDDVRVWVEDNGIGIAREDIPRLFCAFQRLHGKDTYPGTGLGLALVRRAVERMGGRVGVESEPGKGSRFWVELPKP